MEIDFYKLKDFGKSHKHPNCIEIFVKNGLRMTNKHKFQIDDINKYVTFYKYLEKYSMKIQQKSKKSGKNSHNNSNNSSSKDYINPNDIDSIETVSERVMKEQNATVSDLRDARIRMPECPKGRLPNKFQFPDCM